jgi:hypothetical protein
MEWHCRDNRGVSDVAAFEEKAIEKLRLLPKVEA